MTTSSLTEEKLNVIEKWIPDSLELPDGEEIFTDLRAESEKIFKVDLTGAGLEWIDEEIEQHVLETGETALLKDASELERDPEENQEKEVIAKYNEETAEKIEKCREEVNLYREEVTVNNLDINTRIREEEVAARQQLLYEHKVRESELLRKMNSNGGMLQNVPRDKFSWTIEWDRAPQEFSLNITSLRGVRNKLRDGYYVIMASVIDGVGGKTLRFVTGGDHFDCIGCLPPIRLYEESCQVDKYINLPMEMKCPAPKLLRTYACLLFEIWQLRMGNYDRTDKVVGWGIWPLVNRDFKVIEGKFRLPLLRGAVDGSIDTFRYISSSMSEDLRYWLGNLYFEVAFNHVDHSILKARYDALEEERDRNLDLPEIVYPHQKTDKLRLAKTVDDYVRLIVPKLPPRLFFEDVSVTTEGFKGLRRSYFAKKDLRPINATLWEKRAMLDDERENLNSGRRRNGSISLLNDEAEETDRLVRAELSRSESHTVSNVYKHFPDINFAIDDNYAKEFHDKVTDSHILLVNHHTAVASQREFIFLGRRYKDRLKIVLSVLLYDIGVNLNGNSDINKMAVSLAYFFVGLIARNIIHNLGLWAFLNYLDVPLVVNSWNVLHVNIKFEYLNRFYPHQTLVTMLAGFFISILFFLLFSLALYVLILIFKWLPHFATRFMFWLGVCIFFGPFISAATEAAIGNVENGDAFILYNQLTKQERSPMSGTLLTISSYGSLMIIQIILLYMFACAVHLNGRVNDIYDRIMFPERSFFIPHDLEISKSELQTVVKDANKYRDEEKGTVKRIKVLDFNHHYTCYFRARLYKLLSIASDDPDEWISEYIDSIPLRRPPHSQQLITRNLGSYRLGRDILNFMRRHFPHLTVMSDYRLGDMPEDSYYESELLRSVQMQSTDNEDDIEMRTWLKSYFKAQIDGPKPVHWREIEGNEEELDLPTPFRISDWQLLADLIFFETSYTQIRSLSLRWFLFTGREKVSRFTDAEGDDVYAISHFIKGNPAKSTEGEEALGAVIQVYREMPARGMKELSRVFVATPFGSIIEPSRISFSLLEQHTADDTEFWANQAMSSIKYSDQLLMDSERLGSL